MDSKTRRDKLLNILRTSNMPVKGSDLSKKLDVSRQVVVKDIALLRASGIEIIATSNGYIIYGCDKKEFKIKCKNHKNNEELYLELQTIVDLGAKVKDVIIEHPTYGTITADLDISSNRDLKLFMKKVENEEFKQLSSLASEYHMHTIEFSNDEILDEVINELKKINILFES